MCYSPSWARQEEVVKCYSPSWAKREEVNVLNVPLPPGLGWRSKCAKCPSWARLEEERYLPVCLSGYPDGCTPPAVCLPVPVCRCVLPVTSLTCTAR